MQIKVGRKSFNSVKSHELLCHFIILYLVPLPFQGEDEEEDEEDYDSDESSDVEYVQYGNSGYDVL